MENVKLTLETGYEKYGNSSGQQIDTLSIAVCGSDYNDIVENSLDYLDQYETYALEEYDYEADFLATLSKKQARIYIDNQESYKSALAAFTEELRDKAQLHELDETHPLTIAVQEARDNAENTLRREWLYGDYREAGMLRDANKKYGVEFSYDEKTDALSFSIEDGELEDLAEYLEVKKTKKAVGEYIANMIETAAYDQRQRSIARRKENSENYATRKRIREEEEARKEAERVAKLKAIA